MLKAKKFTIIFTFFTIISLFGTTFSPTAAFAAADASSSVIADKLSPTKYKPDEITADLPQYNLFDTDTLYSEAAFMVNLESNVIVCSKNADERMIPASLTKIMTALVCLENITDFSKIVECPYACTDEFWGSNPNFVGASTAGFVPNQNNLTYKDVLYGLMLPSGCEAANIIAYNVAGDISTFVNMMNETAQKIGCTNTHFTNAHGLYDKDNYTTAKDLYLITRYAMETYPEFLEISCAESYEMPPNSNNPKGYTQYHSNRMMTPNSEYYYEGVKGIKTGSINEYFEYNNETKKWEKVQTRGTRTLVSMCEKDGYSYLLVTLGAPFYAEDGKSIPKQQYPYLDHKALYDWAYEEFEYSKVVINNEFKLSANVDLGQDTDEVGLVANGEFVTLLPKDENISDSIVQVITPDKDKDIKTLTAPIEKGTYVCDIQLVMNGEVVAMIPLVTQSYVAVDQNELYQRKIGAILKSKLFIACVCSLVVLIIGIIVIRAVIKHKKKDQRARRKIAVNSQSKPPKDRRK